MKVIQTNKVLDAKGLACPMPIIRTKKAIDQLKPGQVMEVQATDKGSTADIQAWARSTGHHYIGTLEDGTVLKHYLRKALPEEETTETHHSNVMDLDTLRKKIEGKENITILDVRESAEYAFGHIPGAKHIPLGELEERFDELEKDAEIYVVCRSGHRSDRASQALTKKGFSKVVNVIPGMSSWEGPIEK
ncbi:sulfurtransferase TusA family protein [Pullulanibacillus sp. KACC 23026]|uniref:sulfurtransferase TusA family protein n=1 Tax=Pullulanibacillus sp. KACC 23026 TaxID=3028315 RepID=UPI0023B11543|nr:sulfurtransferase TusA family protein [Pullulanibacillus sp. KACC 23026]WEG12122.1 sulfurtransferase TusA family protein [Pullulanibacillus sp. KACC 23026]